MLELVQVAQLLDLGVVNRVFARDLWMRKTSTSGEIDINREPPLARVEIDSLHKPRSPDAKGRLEQFVCHQGYCNNISLPFSTRITTRWLSMASAFGLPAFEIRRPAA